MRLTPVSILRARSTFTSAPFSSARSARLGEQEQSWYVRGKAAIAKYDDLRARAIGIADSAYVREVLSEYNGGGADPRSLGFRRNSIAYAIGEAESYAPVNYGVFANGAIQDRIGELESKNKGFEEAVREGEGDYGVTATLGQNGSAVGSCLPWVIIGLVAGGLSMVVLRELREL